MLHANESDPVRASERAEAGGAAGPARSPAGDRWTNEPKEIRYRSRTCEVLLRRHEEKETDVAIAAAIVESAAVRDCSAILLVSGDTDLVPALAAARKVRPDIRLICLFPPYRSNEAFRHQADAVLKISPRKLPGHLLPDPVHTADGRSLSKPATW